MDWHHSPIHRFGDETTFFITGGTYLKRQYYRKREALDELQQILFTEARKHDCWLQAWALLSNHYHIVVQSEVGERIRQMLARFHSAAAIALNKRDGAPGRQVWFQFWDKTLTFEGSWLARLKYTNENAVHHGIVRVATEYPWCSAAWFERETPRKFAEVVRGIKVDRVKVFDPF